MCYHNLLQSTLVQIVLEYEVTVFVQKMVAYLDLGGRYLLPRAEVYSTH